MRLIVILFFLFTTNLSVSQINYQDSIVFNIKNGFLLSTLSALPISVSIQTFNSNLPLEQKIFYGGVWLTFGIVLDISAIDKFYKARKYYNLKKGLKLMNK
jgi:hypothetical protein